MTDADVLELVKRTTFNEAELRSARQLYRDGEWEESEILGAVKAAAEFALSQNLPLTVVATANLRWLAKEEKRLLQGEDRGNVIPRGIL